MKRKRLICIGMATMLSLCSIPLSAVQAQEALESVPEEEVLMERGREDFEKSVQEITPEAGKVKTANNVGEGYEYREIADGTLEITGYQGNDTELVIPAEIDGKRVTSIGDKAFWKCSGLNGIELPEGLTSIGDSAFSSCNGLSGIEMPSGLTSIGSYTF